MGVVGQKRLHGLRFAGNKDDFRIQVVLGKEPQLGKRLQGSLKTGDAAVCNDDVFVGPCRTAQQKQNNGNDSKNAVEKSIPHGGLAPVKTLSVIFITTTYCQVFANVLKLSWRVNVALTLHRGSVIRLLCPRGNIHE